MDRARPSENPAGSAYGLQASTPRSSGMPVTVTWMVPAIAGAASVVAATRAAIPILRRCCIRSPVAAVT